MGAPPMQPQQHLFHPDQVDEYVAAMRLGVDHLAEALRRVSGPATGQTPEKAARLVSDVDLDLPLGDPAAALDEMSRIYLDDAVWFHEPAYAAHLNCPVVIPALLAELFVSGVNSSPRHLRPERGRHLRRAAPRRLDRRADRLRPGADGIFTSGGTPVQPPGAACSRATGRWRPGRGARPAGCAILASADGALQRPEVGPPARARRRRGGHGSRRRRAPDGRRRTEQGALGLPRRRAGADGGRRHRRHHRLRCDRPAAARSPSCATCTTPGCTSTRRTAAGCWPPAGGATGWPASSGPTR